jgi:acetyl-CoA carboxylase biotin carboxyl carrier protein
MDHKELRALLRLMKAHGVEEFEWDTEDLELKVRFAGGSVAPASAGAHAVAAPVVAAPSPSPAPRPTAEARVIKSPIVGTFYRSPAPDAPAYVNLGDRVRKGQVVCIVEAMKLMNQIESDVEGVVAEVLIENGQPVQFGQELIRLVAG